MNTERIDYSRSVLLAKNSFGRNVKSRKRFLQYFNLLLEQTQKGELEERVGALKEAELALDIYSEKTWLNEAKITEIQKLKESLTSITTNIDSDIETFKRQIRQEEETEEANRLQREYEQNEHMLTERISHNEDILYALEQLHSEFARTQPTQKEFDDLLKRLGEFENNLNKEDFTEEQTKHYSIITEKFSKSVSEIMSRLNNEEEKEYNLKALAAIKEVYDSFKEDEKKYKICKDSIEL